MGNAFLKTAFFFVLQTFGLKQIKARNTPEPFADFYFSTTGNDAWSGKLAKSNAASIYGTFATLRAKQVIRFFKQGVSHDIFAMISRGNTGFLKLKYLLQMTAITIRIR